MSGKCFPMRFAHRGLAQAAPENTLGAFQAAIELGCEGIELDIHMSKDGDPIVVHDNTLTRLSDGVVNKRIGELTTEELLKVDLPYAGHLLPYNPPVPYSENMASVAHYTDEEIEKQRAEDKRIAHLMTFEQFDKWFETVDSDVIIEIEFCEVGLMPRMHEILSRSKNCSRYIIFSGERDRNDEIQSVLKEKGKPEGLRVGANIRWINEETLDFLNSDPDLYEVGLNDMKFDLDDVKLLTDRGIKIFSNLGDYPEWWEAMPGLDVVAFKTNYAGAYTDWLKK